MDISRLNTQAYYWLYSRTVDQIRSRRMAVFVERMGIQEGSRILDLGGHPDIWQSVKPSLNITILNRPDYVVESTDSHHTFEYVGGDACNVSQYGDQEFDLVFSNSVIEHVGNESRQGQFAQEVHRLGRGYWVQTPSKWFPLEPHCGLPFWWFYPQALKQYFVKRWSRTMPTFAEMVDDTRVLTVERMKSLFPESSLFVERSIGLPKSYCLYRKPS